MRLTGEGYELSRDDQLELFLYPLLRNGRSTQDVSHWDFLRGINWIFEKSRLTRNVNRAIWQATIPLYWQALHEWKGIPTNNENCATLENDSSIAEINDAGAIEAWEPVDACEIVSGEQYMPALTRPELLLLKTCLKRGGFNLPLEWREMAKQLFGRFDAELKGEIQLGTDGQKTN